MNTLNIQLTETKFATSPATAPKASEWKKTALKTAACTVGAALLSVAVWNAYSYLSTPVPSEAIEQCAKPSFRDFINTYYLNTCFISTEAFSETPQPPITPSFSNSTTISPSKTFFPSTQTASETPKPIIKPSFTTLPTTNSILNKSHVPFFTRLFCCLAPQPINRFFCTESEENALCARFEIFSLRPELY